jgi:hypothetical protein
MSGAQVIPIRRQPETPPAVDPVDAGDGLGDLSLYNAADRLFLFGFAGAGAALALIGWFLSWWWHLV